MTSKISIDNRELLQKISIGEAATGIDFGNAIVRELAAFRLAAMDSEPVCFVSERNLANLTKHQVSVYVKAKPVMVRPVPLYRHAQPASELKPVGYLFVSGYGAIAYSPTDWGMPGFKLAGQIFGDIDVESQPAPVVPEIDRKAIADKVYGKCSRIPGATFYNAAEFAIDEMEACRAAMLQAVPLTNEGDIALHNYRTALEGIGHIRRTLEETFGGLHGTHVEPDVLMECKTICDAIYAAYRGSAQGVPEEKLMPNSLSMYAVDAVAAIAEVRGWNACRAAMLQESQKSAGASNNCRSNEKVQDLQAGNCREIAETSTGTAITPAAPDKKLTDDVLDEIIAGAKTSMEQYLALSLKAEREVWRKEGPTDDERIMAIEGIHNCERCGGEGWIVGEMGITRCACGQAGNSPAHSGLRPEQSGTSPAHAPSREHFISLCNEFWNWSEMDLVCSDDRGYELRMEWDGKVFKHPVTQALWRMYQAAPTGIQMFSDGYVMVPKEPTDEMIAAAMNCDDVLFNSDESFCVQFGNIYEAMIAAAPQEVQGE
ncbi:hypothetical protein ACT9TU_22925 [Raoultella planticola]|uniref:hypothetical protein n=1 Tax=Raoultella planticola TaxID=575 RepID=UPI004067F209